LCIYLPIYITEWLEDCPNRYPGLLVGSRA